nr:MAG TPA: hypothetical protein [Caudoviricetes sp.]
MNGDAPKDSGPEGYHFSNLKIKLFYLFYH